MPDAILTCVKVIHAMSAKANCLNDPELKRKLQELRRTDNFTNFLYIARAWLVISLAIGGTVACYHWQEAAGFNLLWCVPVTVLAVLVVGASQHQLAGANHEASHYTLFKNRYLNELASDWLCMFPLFSSTYHYRLEHMAHHQFVNDPQRDTEHIQLRRSGHWLGYPVAKARFLGLLAKQIWLINLARYTFVRARYNAVGDDSNPNFQQRNRKLPLRVSVGYLIALVAVLAMLRRVGDPWLLAIVPAGLYVGVMASLAIMPLKWYPTSRLRPVLSPPAMAIGRVTFLTLLFCGLTWTQFLTGGPVCGFFLLLWVVPLVTSFPLFLILRQLVQHGNADRGRLTNTRIFHVHPLIRYAVFPFGMDYHLPHHMYATVPHYRLPACHQTLLEYTEYAEKAQLVEGYFLPRTHHAAGERHPTVLEVLGPEHTIQSEEIFIDDSVLEDCQQLSESTESLLGRDKGEPSMAAGVNRPHWDNAILRKTNL